MDIDLNNPSELLRFSRGIHNLFYINFAVLFGIIGLSDDPIGRGEMYLNLLFYGLLFWVGTFIYNWYCRKKMNEEL